MEETVEKLLAQGFGKRNLDTGEPVTARSLSTRMLWFLVGREIEVTVSDGGTRRLPAGTVVLAEDTTGKGRHARA